MSDSRGEERLSRVLKNKWRLDRVLGSGGMAVVYEATHRNGMRAAVKILHPHLSWEPELRGRFLREGYLANTVDHPGAVRVFDDDIDDDGSVFLVMELLAGESADAARVRHGGKLPVADVVKIAILTLDVLATAHEKGIVHRDVKPDNIFLTSSGGVKVLDFGIARVRVRAAQSGQTQIGSLLGTPAYMAPEQARGQWDDVDARTDLWAFGATLFTLLSGQFVHASRSGAESLVAAVTEKARPLASVAPDAPPALCAIVDRSLRFERDDRWPSARAMQQALIAFARETGLPDVSTQPELPVSKQVPSPQLPAQPAQGPSQQAQAQPPPHAALPPPHAAPPPPHAAPPPPHAAPPPPIGASLLPAPALPSFVPSSSQMSVLPPLPGLAPELPPPAPGEADSAFASDDPEPLSTVPRHWRPGAVLGVAAALFLFAGIGLVITVRTPIAPAPAPTAASREKGAPPAGEQAAPAVPPMPASPAPAAPAAPAAPPAGESPSAAASPSRAGAGSATPGTTAQHRPAARPSRSSGAQAHRAAPPAAKKADPDGRARTDRSPAAAAPSHAPAPSDLDLHDSRR